MASSLGPEKIVPLFSKLSALALLLFASLAGAQNNLGALLDAGAKRLSPEEFKQDVVQRVLVGPTAAGTNLEIMYATSAVISGRGTNYLTGAAPVEVAGEWKIDDSGKICTSMRLMGPTFGTQEVTLPPRCQFWFRHNGQYFISDSDSDRSMRVFRRTLKQ